MYIYITQKAFPYLDTWYLLFPLRFAMFLTLKLTFTCVNKITDRISHISVNQVANVAFRRYREYSAILRRCKLCYLLKVKLSLGSKLIYKLSGGWSWNVYSIISELFVVKWDNQGGEKNFRTESLYPTPGFGTPICLGRAFILSKCTVNITWMWHCRIIYIDVEKFPSVMHIN